MFHPNNKIIISGFLWEFLCEIARQHGSSLRENGCQTDGTLTPQDSLRKCSRSIFMADQVSIVRQIHVIYPSIHSQKISELKFAYNEINDNEYPVTIMFIFVKEISTIDVNTRMLPLTASNFRCAFLLVVSGNPFCTIYFQLNDFVNLMSNMRVLEIMANQVSWQRKNVYWLIRECWMRDPGLSTTLR